MEAYQRNPDPIPAPKSQKTNKVGFTFMLVTILCIALGALALITKAGILPNYFNIEILCPVGEEKTFNGNNDQDNGMIPRKPVIYLYPETQQDIQVQLDYKGTLIADFPRYNPKIKGWKVSASPDGSLVNYSDNREYSYIFWEGLSEKKIDWDLSEGFVIKGEDTREFLQEKLAFMGLSPKEYNEFIVYWYPRMQNNPYNLIHFAGTQYTETAPLTITPTPDAMLRVFMVFKPLQEEMPIKEQSLKTFERKGFSVIEWGGTQAN